MVNELKNPRDLDYQKRLTKALPMSYNNFSYLKTSHLGIWCCIYIFKWILYPHSERNAIFVHKPKFPCSKWLLTTVLIWIYMLRTLGGIKGLSEYKWFSASVLTPVVVNLNLKLSRIFNLLHLTHSFLLPVSIWAKTGYCIFSNLHFLFWKYSSWARKGSCKEV